MQVRNLYLLSHKLPLHYERFGKYRENVRVFVGSSKTSLQGQEHEQFRRSSAQKCELPKTLPLTGDEQCQQ